MQLHSIISNLLFIKPEIILLCVSLFALLYGLFVNKCHVKFILLCGMIVSMQQLFVTALPESIFIFNNSLLLNDTTQILRILILSASILCMLFMMQYKIEFEIPILMTISTLSLMLMVASNDLMTMYLAMEVSSLTMYICVASNKGSYFSTEAGLKYFILGSVASAIFLFGTSIISGFTGSFAFDVIGTYTIDTLDGDFLPIIFIFSGCMILTAFFFKMAVAPFHAWIADVYNGAPWYITLFIGSVSKIAMCGLLVRCVFSLFDTLNIHVQNILLIVSILSIFIGSIGAVLQNDLKRILAYSSVSNIGFAMAGIVSGSIHGIASGFVYIVLYTLLMFIPVFILISILSNAKNSHSIVLSDLAELSTYYPYKTACLAILMFATAGLPPFAGFFGKFHILMHIIAQDMEVLSILFILGAIISTFYCLRIIKNIYFVKTTTYTTVLVTNTTFEFTMIYMIGLLNISYSIYSSECITFFSELFRKLL